MCPSLTNFKALVQCAVDFLEKQIVPDLIGVAVVVFLWGVFKFIKNGGDEKARESGKQVMLWGVIGLFSMLCVWGVVAILAHTLLGGNIVIPQLKV